MPFLDVLLSCLFLGRLLWQQVEIYIIPSQGDKKYNGSIKLKNKEEENVMILLDFKLFKNKIFWKSRAK